MGLRVANEQDLRVDVIQGCLAEGGNSILHENEEESTNLAALMMEGDCVLYFYLEQAFYNCGLSKTNIVFSCSAD